MKKIITQLNGMMLIVAFLSLMFTACSSDEDNRTFESATIVGVKVDNKLYLPDPLVKDETVILLPAGQDISNAKVEIFVTNGELINFTNKIEHDCRKPLMIAMKGFDGNEVERKLRIQSPPKLASVLIKGMHVPAENIHKSLSSLIIQVPVGTNLTALEVTLEFLNGKLMDFENGKPLDYTQPHSLKIKGVDEETIYPYDLMITTEAVGPATINAMTLNGVKTDSIAVKNGKLIPYVPSLLNFTSVNVALTVGFGNRIDAAFNGQNMNLMTGNNKVKVTGTNGIVTEFTIGIPQLSFKPSIAKKYAELGFAANDLCAVGFSGNYLLAGNYTSTVKTPVYFDLQGNKVGALDVTDVDPTSYGFRKFATDDNGVILALSLGMSAGEQWIYKWNNVTGQGTKYLSFSKASLGVDYNPRSAGINISGSLSGDATIIMTIAQNTDVFIWKVTGGVLNPTPQKMSFPYTGASYYWSVVSMPAGVEGYIGFVTNNELAKAGVICLSKTMSELQKVSGFYATDGKVIKYNNRIYLAYVAHSNNKGIMRVCDITDGQLASYQNPIFEQTMSESGANANGTMDADFAIINGKLYTAFACTNLGLYLYAFEN